MLRNRVAAGWVLAVVLLPGTGRADDKPIRAADVPREFRGEFAWRDDQKTYTLVLKIDKVEEKDGVIRFTGTHAYDPGDYTMKVEGTIDPKTRGVRIRESDPSRADAQTDGTFEGTLSADLQSLEAVWTTEDTGTKGDLKVKAKKGK